MYIHLGQSVVVPEEDVIGVFDLDNTTGSKITRNFLSAAEKARQVNNVSDELPRSFVVCSAAVRSNAVSNNTVRSNAISSTNASNAYINQQIYLSQLSPQTLLKRSETMRFE